MSYKQFHSQLEDSAALLYLSRSGIAYELFNQIFEASSFTLKQWSNFLHLTERTLQRYKKEQKTFEVMQSERIIDIAILQKKGKSVFGSLDQYHQWLNASIVALGGVKPMELLDSAYGIEMVLDTLGRIEHGVLA